MSGDGWAEALEQYERAAASLQYGWAAQAAAPGWSFAGGPIYFSPLRNSLVIREGFAMEKRAAGERDRREWIEGIRRRLGLVAEVHRCRAWYAGDGWWKWWCLRPGCPCGGFARRGPGGFEQAVGEALEHARRFVPKPAEEEPFTELDLLAYEAAWDAVRDQQERMAAALPARMSAVAEEINEAVAGLLPDGMRFEWGTDGG